VLKFGNIELYGACNDHWGLEGWGFSFLTTWET